MYLLIGVQLRQLVYIYNSHWYLIQIANLIVRFVTSPGILKIRSKHLCTLFWLTCIRRNFFIPSRSLCCWYKNNPPKHFNKVKNDSINNALGRNVENTVASGRFSNEVVIKYYYVEPSISTSLLSGCSAFK